MTVKGVKLKSESFFCISPGIFELWRKTLGADSVEALSMKLNIICSYICFQERTPVQSCALFGTTQYIFTWPTDEGSQPIFKHSVT